MKKLRIYPDGSEYVIGGLAGLEPNGIEPVREYDIDNFTKDEMQRLQNNKKDKNLLKKARRI